MPGLADDPASGCFGGRGPGENEAVKPVPGERDCGLPLDPALSTCRGFRFIIKRLAGHSYLLILARTLAVLHLARCRRKKTQPK